MGQASPPESPQDGAGLRLASLLPPGAPLTSEQLVEQLGLWERPASPPARPHVMLNMIATVDGRAAIGGRSGTISGAADRALFHALRTAADGVLVGAGTVRTEHYGRIIGDESRRRERVRRGLSGEPLACIVSGRLVLGEDIPLLRAPEAHVVLLTASPASLPATGARIDYIRASGPQLDLPAGLAELSERFGVASLLCEGGPHLAREMLGAGLLDELFLTVAPMLAGGEPSGGEALRILAGTELQPPASLALRSVFSHDSTLFLRYGVSAR